MYNIVASSTRIVQFPGWRRGCGSEGGVKVMLDIYENRFRAFLNIYIYIHDISTINHARVLL